MSRRHPDPAGRQGAAAIEFALVLPVFVVLLTGMFEYSWMFFQRSTVAAGLRAGCRAGAVISPDDIPGPEEIAQDAIFEFLSRYSIDCESGDYECELQIEVDGERPYQTLECQITVDYQPLINLVPVPTSMYAAAITLIELQS